MTEITLTNTVKNTTTNDRRFTVSFVYIVCIVQFTFSPHILGQSSSISLLIPRVLYFRIDHDLFQIKEKILRPNYAKPNSDI